MFGFFVVSGKFGVGGKFGLVVQEVWCPFFFLVSGKCGVRFIFGCAGKKRFPVFLSLRLSSS